MNNFDKLWDRAKNSGKTLVLPEGKDKRTILAAQKIRKDNIAKVIILGTDSEIQNAMKEAGVSSLDATFLDNSKSDKIGEYANNYFEKRKAKGMTIEEATKLMTEHPTYFGAMMVETNAADMCISGAVTTTAEVMKAAITVLGSAPGIKTISSCFVMDYGTNSDKGDGGLLFFGDCAVNPFPNEEQLADIAIATAETAKAFGVTPRVAMLSYSTKGSNTMDEAKKIARATEIVKQKAPDLLVDGELQADAALDATVGQLKSPGSKVAGHANCLIFPDINAGNIGYKLVQRLSGALAVGPIIQGVKKPMNDLSRGTNAEEIAYLAAFQALSVK